MKISIRKKRNKNNTTSLFLEYYTGYSKDKNGKLKLNRKYEFLDMLIYTEPKNKEQRDRNKEMLNLAENIKHKKELESINNDFDFNTTKENNISLFHFVNDEMSKMEIKEGSQTNYRVITTHLFNFCNPDTTLLKNINDKFIENFKEYINNITNESGVSISENTKNLYFTLFRTLITRAVKKGYIKRNPLSDIKAFKKKQTEKIYLNLNEISKIDKTECKSDVVKRAFLFSCFTGLRLSDVRNLKWNQIIKDDKCYKIHFSQQKTGNMEYLPMNEQALKYLGTLNNSNESVFKGIKNGYYLIKVLNEWIINAGITKYITFHCARHTFAILCLNSGIDLYTVSKLLGHKRIETTLIYLQITNDKLMESINKIPKLK